MNTHLWPCSKAAADSAEPKSAFLSNELPGTADVPDLGPHVEGQGQGTASPPWTLTCISTPETPMVQKTSVDGNRHLPFDLETSLRGLSPTYTATRAGEGGPVAATGHW